MYYLINNEVITLYILLETYNKLIISDISCSLGEGTTNINTYNFNLPFYMNIEIEADVYNN